MATKKATASKAKKPAAKKSTPRKTTSRAAEKPQTVIVEENVDVDIVNIEQPAEVEFDEATVAKKTFGEKAAALRPGALLAELAGAFVLAGAVIQLAQGGTVGAVGIALTLAILVTIFGVVSGGHINPAITIAQWINRKVDGVKAFAYILAQVIGAVLAFVVLHSLWQACLNDAIIAALSGQGITAENIKEAGGLAAFLDQYNMSINDAAKQLSISFLNVEFPSSHWAAFWGELVGAVVFGLGVGYAFFTKNKSSIEKGLVVGVSLFAGLTIGGAAAILNPAVAGAIGGFEWVNPFAAGCMTFWWPVFTYVGATVVGITAGFTTYRFVLKDVVAKK